MLTEQVTAHSRIEGLFVFHEGPIQKFFKVKVFIPWLFFSVHKRRFAQLYKQKKGSETFFLAWFLVFFAEKMLFFAIFYVARKKLLKRGDDFLAENIRFFVNPIN